MASIDLKKRKKKKRGIVAWGDLVMCKGELMHQWGRVIWFKLRKRKEVEEDLK